MKSPSRLPRLDGPLIALIFGICTVASCHSPTKNSPEEAVSQLLNNLYRGNWEKAWLRLSEDNRQTLNTTHQALAMASGKDPSNAPSDAILDYGLAVYNEPETVNLVSRPDQRPAQIRVTTANGSAATFLVHQAEDGQWQVDLLGSLKPLDR